MAKQSVFVEVEDGKIIRILRTTAEAWRLPAERVQQWPRSEAVKAIREQVFDRSKGECEDCGRRVTKMTGEMHERIPKGKGGEVSLANSCFLCYYCHQGRKDSAHGDRRWQS